MAEAPARPAQPPFRVQHVFSTPLLIGRFGDEKFIADLERAILARREVDPGIKRSNRGGWHSDVKILEWGGDPARELARRVVEFANHNTMRSDGAPSQFRWMIEGWANVNERGQSNARHIHGGCYWSAVYYVRVDPGKGGSLLLFDPRMPTLAMHAPKLRFRNSGGERIIRLNPQPGRFFIFPSWLDHEVESWDGDGMRISIALNLLAISEPAKPAAEQQPQETLASAPQQS